MRRGQTYKTLLGHCSFSTQKVSRMVMLVGLEEQTLEFVYPNGVSCGLIAVLVCVVLAHTLTISLSDVLFFF
jgi:hypothetical protein